IWADIEYLGKAAHGGLLWDGRNAVVEMSLRINNFIKKNPLPKNKRWMTTYNFGKIEGGVSTNTVPDRCKLTVDIRYLPTVTENKVLTILKTNFPNCSIRINLSEPPIFNKHNNAHIRSLSKEVSRVTKDVTVIDVNYGSTDARYYSTQNIPSVSFGLDGTGTHSDDEQIDISSIWRYEEILLNFINKLK
ncbi:hypothetical protein COY90_05615, partial [Candidatus Roizmanbacteria bacterium CG_4_10_14_0_8_um_filter_39_9]